MILLERGWQEVRDLVGSLSLGVLGVFVVVVCCYCCC